MTSPPAPKNRVKSGLGSSMASATVAATLRALLRIQSAEAAAELLQLTAQQLGATVLPAADAGPDALPIDLSLGQGTPLLAVIDLRDPDRMDLVHLLAGLVEDARQAVDLLRQTEHSTASRTTTTTSSPA